MTTKRLIAALQRYTQVEHVLPVGRASLGIYVALKARVKESGALVAMPASICQDVLAAVLMADCKPFFCDVELTTGLAKESEWQKAKNAGAKVAIVVHLYGNPADTARIKQMFRSPECLLIDDAAQALGAHKINTMAGTGGDVGVLSFGATKHIDVGGAALLIHDSQLAQRCNEIISSLRASDVATRQRTQRIFRQGYDRAREKLIKNEDYSGFNGLLEGYAPMLQVPWQDTWSDSILQQIENYPHALSIRREKAELWREGISGTDLIPLGMDVASGCAPWRFACRWVNCKNHDQLHQLGESLRGAGLHVSHWYLPANWWLGMTDQNMHDCTTLARQTLQFWLDDQTSIETIERWIPIVKEHPYIKVIQ